MVVQGTFFSKTLDILAPLLLLPFVLIEGAPVAPCVHKQVTGTFSLTRGGVFKYTTRADASIW